MEEILEFEDDYEEDKEELINRLYQLQNNFKNFLLKDKPHIKKLEWIKRMTGEFHRL